MIRTEFELPPPPPLLVRTRDLLREQMPAAWEWYSKAPQVDRFREKGRLALLQATLPLAESAPGPVLELARTLARRLRLDGQVAAFRATRPTGEIPLRVFTEANGPRIILPPESNSRLRHAESPPGDAESPPGGGESPPGGGELSPGGGELSALIGCQLALAAIWNLDGGSYLAAYRVLDGLNDASPVQPVLRETARQFELFVRIFADRCSAAIQDEDGAERVASVIAGIGGEGSPGAAAVPNGSPADQAHRLAALRMWMAGGAAAEADISVHVRGPLSLDKPDLEARDSLMKLTRMLIDEALRPAWMRTERTLAHARLFFPDYAEPALPGPEPGPTPSLEGSLADYAGFVLLDFVAADREQQTRAIAHTMGVAIRLGIGDSYAETVRRELRLGKRQLAEILDAVSGEPGKE